MTTITLPPLPDAFGAVTTHTSCQQQFTPWPHPPYLDTATDVQTVYTITQVYAIQREAMLAMREAAAKEFDRRAPPGTGFYTPEEPAEIVRALEIES